MVDFSQLTPLLCCRSQAFVLSTFLFRAAPQDQAGRWFADPGDGYAERLIRTIKEEVVYLHDFDNIHEAQHRIGEFLSAVYNHERIHSTLEYLTPVEFEPHWHEQQLMKEIG